MTVMSPAPPCAAETTAALQFADATSPVCGIQRHGEIHQAILPQQQ
jgi:hypothetical protein